MKLQQIAEAMAGMFNERFPIEGFSCYVVTEGCIRISSDNIIVDIDAEDGVVKMRDDYCFNKGRKSLRRPWRTVATTSGQVMTLSQSNSISANQDGQTR
jgi:hypothetical protein